MNITAKTTSFPESSVFSLGPNGDLMLTLRGTLYPSGGGTHAGQSIDMVNFSEHIRQIVREELHRSHGYGK